MAGHSLSISTSSISTSRAPWRAPSTIRPARAFHLIDAENLAGAAPMQALDTRIGDLYRSVVHPQSEDLFGVAADRTRLIDLATAFPGVQTLIGHGPNGADNALIDAIDWDLLVRRFDTIYIGSGDHWFTGLAHHAHLLGLKVVVVSRAVALSRMLESRADEFIELPELALLPDHLIHAA